MRDGEPPTYSELGAPVAQWVEKHVVDPLTGGRHGMLRDAVHILNNFPPTPPHSPTSSSFTLPHSVPASTPPSDTIRHQIEQSLHTYPAASRALQLLQDIHAGKIDLPSLIRAPDELFHAEDVWAGRAYREKRKREMDEALARDPEKNAAAYLQWAIAEHREAEAGSGIKGGPGGVADEAAMLAYALHIAGEDIARLARGDVKREFDSGGEEADEEMDEKDGGRSAETTDKEESEEASDVDGDVIMKTEDEEPAKGAVAPVKTESAAAEAEAEDPMLKKVRLNLLALAKRAPLDQIMKLPPQLVPAHLRHIVPTADA